MVRVAARYVSLVLLVLITLPYFVLASSGGGGGGPPPPPTYYTMWRGPSEDFISCDDPLARCLSGDVVQDCEPYPNYNPGQRYQVLGNYPLTPPEEFRFFVRMDCKRPSGNVDQSGREFVEPEECIWPTNLCYDPNGRDQQDNFCTRNVPDGKSCGIINGQEHFCQAGSPSVCVICGNDNEESDPIAFCDGADNDCDGFVDNEFGTTNPLQTTQATPDGQGACEASSGVGICAGGYKLCQAGSWTECLEAQSARVEICDGLDEDCDGATDEEVRYIDLDNGFVCGNGGAGETFYTYRTGDRTFEGCGFNQELPFTIENPEGGYFGFPSELPKPHRYITTVGYDNTLVEVDDGFPGNAILQIYANKGGGDDDAEIGAATDVNFNVYISDAFNENVLVDDLLSWEDTGDGDCVGYFDDLGDHYKLNMQDCASNGHLGKRRADPIIGDFEIIVDFFDAQVQSSFTDRTVSVIGLQLVDQASSTKKAQTSVRTPGQSSVDMITRAQYQRSDTTIQFENRNEFDMRRGFMIETNGKLIIRRVGSTITFMHIDGTGQHSPQQTGQCIVNDEFLCDPAADKWTNGVANFFNGDFYEPYPASSLTHFSTSPVDENAYGCCPEGYCYNPNSPDGCVPGGAIPSPQSIMETDEGFFTCEAGEWVSNPILHNPYKTEYGFCPDVDNEDEEMCFWSWSGVPGFPESVTCAAHGQTVGPYVCVDQQWFATTRFLFASMQNYYEGLPGVDEDEYAIFCGEVDEVLNFVSTVEDGSGVSDYDRLLGFVADSGSYECDLTDTSQVTEHCAFRTCALSYDYVDIFGQARHKTLLGFSLTELSDGTVLPNMQDTFGISDCPYDSDYTSWVDCESDWQGRMLYNQYMDMLIYEKDDVGFVGDLSDLMFSLIIDPISSAIALLLGLDSEEIQGFDFTQLDATSIYDTLYMAQFGDASIQAVRDFRYDFDEDQWKRSVLLSYNNLEVPAGYGAVSSGAEYICNRIDQTNARYDNDVYLCGVDPDGANVAVVYGDSQIALDNWFDLAIQLRPVDE